MNSLFLLLLFVFIPVTRGGMSPDYLSFESDHLKQNQSADEANDSIKTFPLNKETQRKNEKKIIEKEEDDLYNMNYSNEYAASGPSAGSDAFSENFFKNFVKIYPNDYNNYDENFQSDEEKNSQVPIRRQISNWKASDEFSDPSNIPLSIDAYYPKAGSPYVQNEYYEDVNYSADSDHKNNSNLESPTEHKDNSFQVKHPHYYQKNYYYNYYPQISGRKYPAPKRSDEETVEDDQSEKKLKGRKHFRKDACKKYLEFLRYAFNELDESYGSEHKRSDYNEEYTDEWEERSAQKKPRVFSTHLLGPTLYIDNSGKVSQINSQGNSVQMIENISPSSILSNSNDVVHSKITTLPPFVPATETETDLPTTLSNLNHDNMTVVTTVRPVLRMEDNEENTTPGVLEPQTQIPEIKTGNPLPKAFGRWTHTLDMYAARGRFSTTVSTDLKSIDQDKMIHDNDYGKSTLLPKNYFSPPYHFPVDDYHRRSDSSLEQETPNVIYEKTNSSVGPALYWYVHSSTPTPPPIPSISPSVNQLESKTVVTFGNSAEPAKEEDCNDKTLPCPDTVNVTYPLNGYCNRYVTCESGRAIRRTCPEGLHFNIITKSCDFPHNSFCTYTCPQPDGYYGIPGDCSGYFICKNYVPEYRMCPPRMHWDINRRACTFAELSSCPMKCFKTNEIRPYEGDCKAYIICLNGVPYYHKCPPNTKFDIKNQMCVPEGQSICVDDPRLLTKTSNPNTLCRDVEVKLGNKTWCSYFFPSEKHNYKK